MACSNFLLVSGSISESSHRHACGVLSTWGVSLLIVQWALKHSTPLSHAGKRGTIITRQLYGPWQPPVASVSSTPQPGPSLLIRVFCLLQPCRVNLGSFWGCLGAESELYHSRQPRECPTNTGKPGLLVTEPPTQRWEASRIEGCPRTEVRTICRAACLTC